MKVPIILYFSEKEKDSGKYSLFRKNNERNTVGPTYLTYCVQLGWKH